MQEPKFPLEALKHHNMFCRIYTEGNSTDSKELLAEISYLLQKPIVDDNIEIDESFISVRLNDEYDRAKRKDFPDGFLHFKELIEIDYTEENSKEIKGVVSSILNFLWERHYAAIASCQFENELPYKGGYNNTDLPWPI